MNKNIFLKILAVICGISGIGILLAVIIPIVSYESSSKQNFSSLISPESVKSEQNGSNLNTDYTKASTWFIGGAKEIDFNTSKVSFYTISVPKLKIENATVAIGGEDLSKNMIQYPGTALPGKIGNSVIFGHSVLPIFFNPKDYTTIFSTLPNLKKSDEIDVYYDGVSFIYKVEAMFEVTPADIQVLEQDRSDSFLTLVTCVPPGDPRKPKRLIVRARIMPFNETR